MILQTQQCLVIIIIQIQQSLQNMILQNSQRPWILILQVTQNFTLHTVSQISSTESLGHLKIMLHQDSKEFHNPDPKRLH